MPDRTAAAVIKPPAAHVQEVASMVQALEAIDDATRLLPLLSPPFA
jgi:hypothetical protein